MLVNEQFKLPSPSPLSFTRPTSPSSESQPLRSASGADTKRRRMHASRRPWRMNRRPRASSPQPSPFPPPGRRSQRSRCSKRHRLLWAGNPSVAPTGPDGAALRSVPLVVDAEFKVCYSVHGPGVQRPPRLCTHYPCNGAPFDQPRPRHGHLRPRPRSCCRRRGHSSEGHR